VNSAAIITDAFPKKELGMGLGTNMMAATWGDRWLHAERRYDNLFGWQSMFLINVPIGIFGTVWVICV